MDRNHHERRLGSLKQERQSWEAHWRDVSDYVLPRRGRFMAAEGAQGRSNRGDKINNKILDSTATFALNTLVSGMMSGVTSPARPWFRLVTSDPDMMEFGPVKEWLYTVENTMRRIFAASNVYNCLQGGYEEIAAFGTSALLIEEDYTSVIRGYPFTCGEFLVANGPRLTVDTLYREYQLTVEQTVGQFGIEAVSPTTRNLYDRGDYDQWIDVCHAIEPNPMRSPEIAGHIGPAGRVRDKAYLEAAKKPIRSCYWEKGAKAGQYLRMSGYNEFPAMVPRWHVTGTDVYGRSPAMDALADVKQLQKMERKAAQAVDKMVDPPMQGPSSMRQNSPSILPGAMNYVDAMGQGQGFRPAYEVNPRLAEFHAKTEETRGRIRQALYADLFLMFAGDMRASRATATEVAERSQEKLLALGPVLERLQNELLEPLIDRTFAIMVRNSEPAWAGRSMRGMLPPPPDELKGMDLKIDYISMLAQAQRAVATTGIERLAGFVGNLAAANPDVLDKVDFDQAVDEYATALGVSPLVVRSDEKVAALRGAKAKATQMAQAAQAGMGMVQGAKVLSEVDTETSNGLTSLLGINAA